MNLVDTHTHIFLNQFDADRDKIISRALKKGIEKMFLPNVDLETLQAVKLLSEKYPKNCFPLIGLHPCSVKDDFEEVLNIFEIEIQKNKYYGIGESGIDLYWDKSSLDIQKQAFIRQIEWAKKYNLPIVIHARNSFDEIFEIVDNLIDDNLFGIFHCFTSSYEHAEKILSYKSFMFGVGGVVTYKNSGLDKVLTKIPIEKIVLETDSPYLTPVPFRGKRNESSYLVYIVKKLSEIYNIDKERIAEITTKNALKIFNIESKLN